MSLDLYDNFDASSPPAGRPFIGVLFDCCGVYARVYRQPDERVYQGRCPRCLRVLSVRVAPNGTTTRLFRAE
jgi:hypothetical protein